MKTSLIKHFFQAGLACMVLTAGAGLAYGQLYITWPADSESAMTAGQGTPNMTWAADATIPAGLGTDGLTWGNNLSSTFQQVYYSVGGSIGDKDVSMYSKANIFLLPGTGNSAGAFQLVLQSNGNGYMQPSLTPTTTSLANGWKEISFSLSDPNFTDLTTIWSIGMGFWQPTGGYQMEVGGITFTGTTVPEPSTLFFCGLGLLGFISLIRRKIS